MYEFLISGVKKGDEFLIYFSSSLSPLIHKQYKKYKHKIFIKNIKI